MRWEGAGQRQTCPLFFGHEQKGSRNLFAFDITQAGDHDLFRGEVVAQHVDEAILNADGAIAIDRLNPLSYVLGQYWSLGRHLGDHGFTKKGGEG